MLLPRPVEQASTCLIYLVCVLVFFGSVLLFGQAFPRDGRPPGFREAVHDTRVLDPHEAMVRDASLPLWLLGRYYPWRLPLWNPSLNAGEPLAANPAYGAYAPLSVVFSQFPGSRSRDLFFLLRLLVTGLFTIALVYRLGGRAVAALVSALALTVTGEYLWRATYLGQNTAMWLPAMFWATDRLVARPRKFGPAVGLAAIWAVALLGGQGGGMALLFGANAAFFLWRAVMCAGDREGVFILDSAVAFVGAAALAVGATLFYIAPMLQWRLSAHRFWSADAPYTGTPVSLSISLFSPFFLTGLKEADARTALPHFGACLLVLMCFCLTDFENRSKKRLFFIIGAVFVAIRAMGAWMMHMLGGAETPGCVLTPGYLPFFYFCLAMLAGFGAENILNRLAHPLISAGLLLGLLFAYVLLFWRTVSWIYVQDPTPQALTLASHTEAAGYPVLIVLALVGGLAWVAIRLPRWTLPCFLLVMAATAAQVWRHFPSRWPERRRVAEAPAYVDLLKNLTSRGAWRVGWYGDAIALDDAFRFRLPAAPSLAPGPRMPWEQALAWDLIGTRYIVNEGPLDPRVWGGAEPPRQVAADGPIRVFESPYALARARVLSVSTGRMPAWRLARRRRPVLPRIAKGELDPRWEVEILGPLDERDAEILGVAGEGTQATETTVTTAMVAELATGDFAITSYAPHRVVVEGALDGGPGWLVLSDAHYPGWSASVDGASRRVYLANSMMRATLLEPGEHRVVFRYRPWTFYLGAIGSVLTLLIAFRVRRRLKRGGQSSFASPVEYVAFK